MELDFHICTVLFFTNSTLFLPTAHYFTNNTLFYQQHIFLPTTHYFTNNTLFYQQRIVYVYLRRVEYMEALSLYIIAPQQHNVLPIAHCFTNFTLFYQQHIVSLTAHYFTNSTFFNSYSNIACINFMRTIQGWDEPS